MAQPGPQNLFVSVRDTGRPLTQREVRDGIAAGFKATGIFRFLITTEPIGEYMLKKDFVQVYGVIIEETLDLAKLQVSIDAPSWLHLHPSQRGGPSQPLVTTLHFLGAYKPWIHTNSNALQINLYRQLPPHEEE